MQILFSLSLILFITTSALAEVAPIKIGWSGPLSGDSAILGVDSVQAAQIAIDEVNTNGGVSGHKVILVAEDDQYDTSKAISAYNKLTTIDKVTAILMSTYGGVMSTGQHALRDDIIIINPLDCNNDIAKLPKNTFCIATESESIGQIIAEDIISKKMTKVGVIFDESNPFMVLVNDALKSHLNRLGVSDIISHAINGESSDFKSHVLKLRRQKPQALVLFGHDTMGLAMRQARQLGLSSQFYTLGTITSPGYQKLAGKSAEGALVAYWSAPKSQPYHDFISKFTKKVGRPPILELATIPSYDSTKLLLKSLSFALTSNGTIDVGKLRENLYSTKNHQGLSGVLTMDPDGAVRSIKERIYKFNNGILEQLD